MLFPAWQHRLINARDRLFHARQLSRAGMLPYNVIYDDGLVRVRHYARRHGSAAGRPLIVVAPLAINMLIYDLFPERSMLRFLTQHGKDVYLVDWGTPDRRHNHLTLASYSLEKLPACIRSVREHSHQQEIDLHGWSMGGHMVLCYAGQGNDSNIRHIVIAGTYINSHANGSLGTMALRINRGVRAIEKYTGIHRNRWPASWFYSPGWYNALNFKLTSPAASLRGYRDLLRNLGDREYVVDHATQSAFLDHMVAYPGGVTRDMFLAAWLGNLFHQGQWTLEGKDIDLRRIQAPLLLIAGRQDTLATPASVEPIMAMTSATRKRFMLIEGGHMGIISGREAARQAWPAIVDWLAQ